MNTDRIGKPRRAAAVLALAAVALAGAGCSLFHKAPPTAANIAAPGQGNLTLSELQNMVIRFADDYS